MFWFKYLSFPQLWYQVTPVSESNSNDNSDKVTFYCTKPEWDLYNSSNLVDTLSSLYAGLMMGVAADQSDTPVMYVLSPRVLEEVLIELESDCPFLCADCDKCFSKLHLLTCHLQYYHFSKDDSEGGGDDNEVYDDENAVTEDVEPEVDEKTGENPSLEKPFQCETCEKCFANYSNMMSHVEHHHGWSRQCNFGNCTSQLSSIAEFVTHHVRHVDANFEIPDTNHERNTISCLCPVCGKKSMGVNRHWEHSFIHDKVARFKCPLCDRRVNKVQNLKDHIKRHLGPQSKTKNCEICDKKFCPADIYKHMKTVHGKQDVKYPCTICGKIFPVLHKLQHHSLTHK